MKRLCGAVVAAVVGLGVSAAPAEAGRSNPCRTVAPGTHAAQVCESNGWMIRRQFAVNPNRVAARVSVDAWCGPTGTNCYWDNDWALHPTEPRSFIRYRQGGLDLIVYVLDFRNGQVEW